MPAGSRTDIPMKNELIDVTATQKSLVIEIEREVVDSEIERVTRDYSRAAKVPGFRPGKVPAKVVRQRFRDQILHEVAHELVPRAVDDALRARGLEPIETPNVRDVEVEEGRPLKFTASFETVPPLDPGDYTALALRRRPATVEPEAVEQALGQLRERAARFDPVEGRAAAPPSATCTRSRARSSASPTSSRAWVTSWPMVRRSRTTSTTSKP